MPLIALLASALLALFNTGGVRQVTSYAYDPLDQIVSVADDRNNVTRAEYDNFGRRVAIDSPDAGRTTFEFDLASNLRKKVTANLRAASQDIAYAYDFNRLNAIVYPQFPENNVAYTYGAPGATENRANRVQRMTAESGVTDRSYGPLGELVRETKTVNSDTGPDPIYTTTWRFDTWNRVQSLTYPDSEVLDFDYDSGGLVTRITGRKTNDAYTYLSFMGYDKFEARERVLMATARRRTTPTIRRIAASRTSWRRPRRRGPSWTWRIIMIPSATSRRSPTPRRSPRRRSRAGRRASRSPTTTSTS